MKEDFVKDMKGRKHNYIVTPSKKACKKYMTTIKKLILLALTALVVIGCEETKTKEYRYNVSDINIPDFDRSSDCVVIIDSCEYVHMWKRLAHKGNCRFCKERDSIKWEKRKNELEELIIKLKEK